MYDIAIIGAGPAGYVAAIRAVQLGAKTALVERETLGGVCLNRGCIPTKALIASAHILESVKKAGEFGVSVHGTPSVEMQKIKSRKDSIVASLRSGIEKLLKGNGIDVISGEASFTGSRRIKVSGSPLEAKYILIATGSSWADLPNFQTNGTTIVTSDAALDWTDIPASLAIIGGGVVGCEFACVMRTFGAKVTIIETMASVLPAVENSISRLLAASMKKRGIEIVTGMTVAKADAGGNEVRLTLSSGKEICVSKVLISVGRRPNTDNLNLEACGVEKLGAGFIKIDKRFATTCKGVYAAGDVIGPPMLAHAASAEGISAVEGIFGRPVAYDPKLCPSPIFTIPEVASVGWTSEELGKAGVEFRTGRFPYLANGRAACDGETEGQVVIHTTPSGEILGVHIIGRDAALIIAEAATAMKNGLTAKDIAETIHAHPTLSEVLAEAAANVSGKAIHKQRTIVR